MKGGSFLNLGGRTGEFREENFREGRMEGEKVKT